MDMYYVTRRHITEENNKHVLRHGFPESHVLNFLPIVYSCAICTLHGAQI
jgi:hypothetical protein